MWGTASDHPFRLCRHATAAGDVDNAVQRLTFSQQRCLFFILRRHTQFTRKHVWMGVVAAVLVAAMLTLYLKTGGVKQDKTPVPTPSRVAPNTATSQTVPNTQSRRRL